MIFITNESTTTVYNTSEMSFTIETDEISCSFLFQVAAVNPAGVGVHSPPKSFDCEFVMTFHNFLHLLWHHRIFHSIILN